MAADTSRRAETTRKARRAERAPSGGWRTIAAKELADHLGSVRFFVLLIVVAAFAALPMIFRSNELSSDAPQLSGVPALFLALFVTPPQGFNGFATVTFVALLVPLVGIAFGFDGINSERSQGTFVPVAGPAHPSRRRRQRQVHGGHLRDRADARRAGRVRRRASGSSGWA